MNPLSWRPEHRAALVAFIILGGVVGLLAAWFESPLYRLSSASLSGPDANTTRAFIVWIQFPGLYWLWVAFGAGSAGLLFYAVQLGRLPRHQ